MWWGPLGGEGEENTGVSQAFLRAHRSSASAPAADRGLKRLGEAQRQGLRSGDVTVHQTS